MRLVHVTSNKLDAGLGEEGTLIFQLAGVGASNIVTQPLKDDADVTIETAHIQQSGIRAGREARDGVSDHQPNVRLDQCPVLVEHPLIVTERSEHRRDRRVDLRLRYGRGHLVCW